MTEEKTIDRVLRIALLVFMFAAGALLVRHVGKLREREQEIVKIALSRAQEMLHIRMDAMFHEWNEVLREEAVAVANMDSVEIRTVWKRWVPLLGSKWELLSVCVGDERGNEIAVYRNDTVLDLVTTVEGSKSGQPMAVRIGHDGLDTTATPWVEQEGYDPRERIWFSKALENDRDEPVWNLRQFGDTAGTVLQVSLMVRGPDPSDPYRVVILDVDLGRSDMMDAPAYASDLQGVLVLSTSGRVMLEPSAERNPILHSVAERVRIQWLADQQLHAFEIPINDKTYRGLLESYRLNGLDLHSCALLDTAPITEWTAADRRVEWTATIMLVVLASLLIGLWLRARARTKALRQEARQSRTQARKLDKVIGEREVLSREVHHRVKNNLQVVSSLLNLQAATLDDGPVRDEFLRSKRRIDTIALVHHKLYGLTDLRNVDLGTFFGELIEALSEMHRPQSRTVSTQVECAGIKCDQDTAIELGMILCELMANAYQHAFPYASGGHVEVIVANVEGDLHRLVVRNNGVALPKSITSGPGKLGLEIVDALSGQLDGSFHIRTEGGVTFEVLFRMRRPAVVESTAALEDPA